MTRTLNREKENFPTSAKKASIIAEEITTQTVKELSQKPCGEALFCEKGMLCDGIRCIPSESER